MTIKAIPVGILFLWMCGFAGAQGTYQFLGDSRSVPDRYSPRHRIRYNTGGFENPVVNWVKRSRRLRNKGVPEDAINKMAAFPGSPDAFGKWADDAFDSVQEQFIACGGALANRARVVSPANVHIVVLSTIWYEPRLKRWLAGAYYPEKKEIRVVNIYYTWSGPQAGWLRHARDLILWEMGNYFAGECRVRAEPRPGGWPCSSPRR